MLLPGQVNKLKLADGEAVFREGDVGDAAYLIESGSVVIRKEVEEGEMDLATLLPGEFFGEMSIIDGSPRMASAFACHETVLIKIPRAQFEAKIKGYDPFMRALVQILVNNLRQVHRAYMRRPRSVQDYLVVLSTHAAGMRRYFGQLVAADPDADALQKLKVMETAIDELQTMFRHHQDRRRSVITDADLKGGLMYGKKKDATGGDKPDSGGD